MLNGLLIMSLWALLLTSTLQAEPATRVAVMLISEKSEAHAPNLDLVTEYCAKAKVNCEVVALPTHRAFAELNKNNVQFLMSLDHQPPGLSPLKIARIKTVAIVALAHKAVEGCESMHGMNFAAFRNVHYAKKLMERCPGVKITWASTYIQGMRMYRSGRVDGMIGVERNLDGKTGFVQTDESDVRSQISTEDLWLFGNSISKNSEAAARFVSSFAQ